MNKRRWKFDNTKEFILKKFTNMNDSRNNYIKRLINTNSDYLIL